MIIKLNEIKEVAEEHFWNGEGTIYLRRYVDEKGNTISNVQVCDSEGKAIARIEHLYGKGGRYGTFCNLMGDGLESTGEKIGRMISYSILKKKYIDK